MKNILFVASIIFYLPVYCQFDSTWNHSIMEADLVLKINVIQTYYITDGGIFEAEILEVVKGNFTRKKLSWSMGMIESSTERWEKRYRAIWPKDLKNPCITYVGFNLMLKNVPEDPKKPFSDYYEFFMSDNEIK